MRYLNLKELERALANVVMRVQRVFNLDALAVKLRGRVKPSE